MEFCVVDSCPLLGFLGIRIRERKTSVTVLLCGTSGCGKSTLASLLVKLLSHEFYFPATLINST